MLLSISFQFYFQGNHVSSLILDMVSVIYATEIGKKPYSPEIDLLFCWLSKESNKENINNAALTYAISVAIIL